MSEFSTSLSEQITRLWQSLSRTQQMVTGILGVVGLVAIIFFVRWAQTPDYAVAFTSLTEEDAAAIVEKLKEDNIPYQLSDSNSVIQVPSQQVHEVRLNLAREGLPRGGVVGFELFDTTNLGMTEFSQQINYQRALEGELARTISSLAAVERARVHIVIPQPSLFSDEEKAATASLTLKVKPGQRLDAGQVRGISHLVASSVEGLGPENITIIDTDGTILYEGAGESSPWGVSLQATSSQLEAQRAYEQTMERRIKAMLDEVLGPNRTVVRVTADMIWDQVETSSETYSPGDTTPVMRSSREVSELYSGADAAAGGIPGTTTNLSESTVPTYQSTVTGTTTSGYQRRDTTYNYEVSKTVSRQVVAPGKVERLSISVVLDTITDTTQLNTIEQLTSTAAGIDTERGDVVTVRSIAFDRSYFQAQEQAMADARKQELYYRLAQWGALAIALLFAFLFIRGLFRNLQRQVLVTPSSQTVLGTIPAVGLLEEPEETGPMSLAPEQEKAAEKAQVHRQLMRYAKTQPEAMAQIIQFWMAED